MCYSEQCCVYGRNRQNSAVWHGKCAVLCDSVYIGIWCCVCKVSSVVLVEGTQKLQCGTVGVLYCVTMCILVLGVECVTVSSVVYMEGTDRQYSVARLVCCIVGHCVYWYWVLCVLR